MLTCRCQAYDLVIVQGAILIRGLLQHSQLLLRQGRAACSPQTTSVMLLLLEDR